MATEKVPFVDIHEVQRRPKFKQYRPLSTRPWVLLIFLAATGLCFGALVAVSLIDKQTSLSTKRDVDNLAERHVRVKKHSPEPAPAIVYTLEASAYDSHDGLRRRQSTGSPTVVYTTPTSAELSLTSPSSTTVKSTLTSADLSLTSSSTTSRCVVTVAVTVISYTKTVGSGSGIVEATTISSLNGPTTGSCTSVTMTVTSGAILSLTSQTSSTTEATGHPVPNTVLSLTSQTTTTSSIGSSTTTRIGLSLTSQSSTTKVVSQITYGSELSLKSSSKVSSSTTPAAAIVSTTTTTTSTGAVVSQISDGSAQLSLTSQTSGMLLLSSSSTNPATAIPSTTQTTLVDPMTGAQLSLTTPASTQSSTFPTSTLSLVASSSAGLSLTSQGLSHTQGSQTISLALPSSSNSKLATSAAAGSSSLQSVTAASALSVLSLSGASTFLYNGATTNSQSIGSSMGYSGAIVLLAIVPETTIDGSVLASTTLTITTVPATGSESSVVTLTATIVPIQTAGSSIVYGASIPGITMAGTTVAPTTAASFAVATNAASPARTSSLSSTSTSAPVDPTVNADLVLLKIDFQNYDYFLAMYLPKIIAVILGCIWSIIFASLKLMEPFYRLSARSGAFAKEALFGNYLASEILPSSLAAMFRGQWVLILGATCLLGWAGVIALCSEAMLVISKGKCMDAEGKEFRCNPGWAVDLPILRTLMVLIGLIFVLTFIITWIMYRRRRTGVYADPSSIAAMNELLGHPEVMQELRGIDPLAADKEIQAILEESRYKLGFYDVTTGKEIIPGVEEQREQRYGLIKISSDFAPAALTSGNRVSYGAVANPGMRNQDPARINRKRRLYQGIFDSIMLLTELALFGIVLGYYLDGKSDPFNDFFNSTTFGPRFVLTCLGLILSAGWRITSQEVTLMAPYRNMARAYRNGTGAHARQSILAATACTPFTAVVKGVILRNYLITATAMSAVLSEILLIAVSGVPFNAGQIKPSLQASSFTSLGILFIMTVNTIAVMIYKRTSAGGTRRLPRQPDTLINVWLYLSDSSLSQHNHDDDDGIPGPLDQKGMSVRYGGANYAFARVLGTDSVPRWTIDQASELQRSTFQQRPYQLHRSQPASERPISSAPSAYSDDSYVAAQDTHEVAAQRQKTARQQQEHSHTPRHFVPLPKTRTDSIDRSYYAEAPEHSSTPTSTNAPGRRHRQANFSLLGRHNERQGYQVVNSAGAGNELFEDERADLGTNRYGYDATYMDPWQNTQYRRPGR